MTSTPGPPVNTADGQVIIPKAEHIADVATFVGGRDVETVLQGLEEQRRQFKQVEQQCVQRKARLLVKQPEIQKALDIVTLLREREQQGDAAPVTMDYELAESVYAKARVGGVKTVNLWLGAGVMAEYPLQEAKELLEGNLSICKANVKSADKDIEVIRDNVTTLEVSLSRVWNFDVERRRSATTDSKES